MKHYNKLSEHYKKIANFEHLASVAGWDQAVMMPAGGNESRAKAMAELSVHIHQLSTSEHLGELFADAQSENISAIESASLREMKASWQKATVLPARLVEAQSLAGSKCGHAWRTQRGENDWQGFSKNFAEVVLLSQEEASIRADAANKTPYDAMLDLYEPGTTSEQLDSIFGNLKTWLPDLTQKVQLRQSGQQFIKPTENYSTKQQNALGLDIMKLLEFDFNHGRLDISAHPFCGGTSQDVRITTRYDETDFIQSMMGIVHETGHARYEQGLPKSLKGLPVGEARSMGIHESQSLFFEMQLGRSKEFIDQLVPLVLKHFPDNNPAVFEADNLQKIYTRVNPGLIRVDADEVTYPAHIMLRYEIERDLMNGNINYTDIPELWDLKMQQYLGISTAGNYKNGCMQDIHWTDGAFGYFPSYTLGAMYAAQFMTAMKKQVDVNTCLSEQNLKPIFNWLNKNIWSKASLLTTDQLVKQATGETLNPALYGKHLQQRYLS
ncbi:Carboxypeptidase Taq [Psychromonas ingrahamii 37]|uniref:Metal-dependent carboxypeptidase n=1 Tax=Psychromonas ingrahamii (strain DSM 17664 / CCUG 51855 / 37) TaxID=357804 RepID=A1STQ8_PSYIN|nr:carboxypeptidase M32 [Psychromonas ingrahamii]ABM02873.1 Carboxypeptidase Taq [Psychromonas ingrahamii 37]